MQRRSVLKGLMAVSAAGAVLGPDLFRGVGAAEVGDGPFGPPTVDSGFGFNVPEGFSARVVAVGGEAVDGTDYVWHPASDGAGTYATPDGGFVLVSNSESGIATGGASAIKFGPPDADGVVAVEDAYRILGTDVGTPSAGNCAGGVTPWGTWFSCEENDGAQHVWECDPTGQQAAIELPQLGTFAHEAAVVDPHTGTVYMTEDTGDSRLFRWVPDVAPAFGRRPDFDNGRLQVASFDGAEGVTGTGTATWIDVDASDPATHKAPGSTSFVRGEGIWYHDRVVYWVASTFSQIFAYDTRTDTQEVLHDPSVVGSPMNDADNLTVHPLTGDIYISEDAPQSVGIDILVITAPDAAGVRTVAPIIRADAGEHAGSEFTGPVFDPSGTRFYFSSQRMMSPNDATNATAGVIYEVTGPFVRQEPQPAPTTTSTTAPPTGPPTEPIAGQVSASPAPTPAGVEVRGGSRLADTGGDDALGWAGLGIGVVGAWAARRARALDPADEK